MAVTNSTIDPTVPMPHHEELPDLFLESVAFAPLARALDAQQTYLENSLDRLASELLAALADVRGRDPITYRRVELALDRLQSGMLDAVHISSERLVRRLIMRALAIWTHNRRRPEPRHG